MNTKDCHPAKPGQPTEDMVTFPETNGWKDQRERKGYSPVVEHLFHLSSLGMQNKKKGMDREGLIRPCHQMKSYRQLVAAEREDGYVFSRDDLPDRLVIQSQLFLPKLMHT